MKTDLVDDISAASSPTSPVSSTSDFNRSMLPQRSLFGSNNQTTPPHNNYSNVPPLSHNPTATGPPTQVRNVHQNLQFRIFSKPIHFQSLFDSLRVEQNSIMDSPYSQKLATNQRQNNPNQSIALNQSVCDSYLNQSNFNVSR